METKSLAALCKVSPPSQMQDALHNLQVQTAAQNQVASVLQWRAMMATTKMNPKSHFYTTSTPSCRTFFSWQKTRISNYCGMS
ncbi:uncharacterized protein LOC144883368 isoform X2 [Branchiostoma floridae x Branchiostoma japonicum]